MYNPFDDDELLDELSGDLYFLLSDQFYSHDDIFRIPIHNRKSWLQHARTFFEFCKTIPPESDLYPRYNALKDMLAGWRRDGEDVDRLFEWYKSISGWGIGKSYNYWHLVMWWWANGLAPRENKHLPQDRFDAFMQVVHRDYTIPRKKFRGKTKDEEEQWVEVPGTRSPWDEYLWEVFFEELWISPETYYYHRFDTLAMMQFWKKHRYFLSQEEQELLLADMTDIHVARDKGNNEISWENIATLEDTLTIDNWPDFDTYKRDW